MSAVHQFTCWIRHIDWTPDAVTAGATVVLACITFILGAGTLGLWRATKKLVRGADDTAKRQLRAYVHVETTVLRRDPQGTPGWEAHIIVRNFGRTPAYGVVATIEKSISTEVTPGVVLPLSDKAIVDAGSDMGPSSTMTVTVDFSDEIPGEWKPLRDQKKKAVLWGVINYVDAFERPRFTTFQLVHNLGNIEQFICCDVGNGTEFRLRKRRRFFRRKERHS